MPADPPAPLRLTRGMRLKQGRDFARVKAQGKRLVCGCLIANWLELPPGLPLRLGVITSRKVGEAVARNRARRLLREAFRLHQHDLRCPVDLVLVARNSISGKKLAGVEQDFLKALRQAKFLKTTA